MSSWQQRWAAFAGIALLGIVGCRDPFAELQDAARKLAYRPIEGRIYQAPYVGPYKRATDVGLPLFIRAVTAAKSDESRARAALWAGKAVNARQWLQNLTSAKGASAAVWSDYSAALHSAASPEDTFQQASALAAADHALDIDPQLAEALFNRAVALEALPLPAAAAIAYQKYLVVDSSSPWAAEARSRLEAIDAATKESDHARQMFARAAESDDELVVNDAAIAFPEQARRWAERTFPRQWSDRLLDGNPADAASSLKRYRVIGRALEMRGDGFIADASRVIAVSPNRSRMAKAYRVFARGMEDYTRMDLDAARKELIDARRLLAAEGSPLALVTQQLLAEVHRMRREDRRFALTIDDLSRRTPERYPVLRARLETSRGMEAAARGQVTAALKFYRSASTIFASTGERASAAQTGLLEASVLTATGQTHAAWRLRRNLLTAAIEDGQQSRLIPILAGAARDASQRRRSDIGDSLINAISGLEPKWPGSHAERLAKHRATSTGKLRSAGVPDSYTQLLQARATWFPLRKFERHRCAFADSPDVEDLRGNLIHFVSPTHRELPPESDVLRGDFPHLQMHLHRAPPDHTLIVSYDLLNDRLEISARNGAGLTRVSVIIKRSELERLVASFEYAIKRDDGGRRQQFGRALYRILVAPIVSLAVKGDSLVFVRDPAFDGLPFAALVGNDGRFLVEHHAVVVTPSISAFLWASLTTTKTSRAIVAVGNSVFRGEDGAASPLAAAQSEAQEVAAMYPSSVVLVGADATKERAIGALAYCDAAHFAVHANSGLGAAMPPHLVLTPSASDDGMLTAADVALLELRRLRTVVLSGCKTAASSPGMPGTDNLVDAFLEAGVGSVVATLWEVEDAPTREISLLLHRELHQGVAPAEALRASQVEMIRGCPETDAEMGFRWSGVQIPPARPTEPFQS